MSHEMLDMRYCDIQSEQQAIWRKMSPSVVINQPLSLTLTSFICNTYCLDQLLQLLCNNFFPLTVASGNAFEPKQADTN